MTSPFNTMFREVLFGFVDGDGGRPRLYEQFTSFERQIDVIPPYNSNTMKAETFKVYTYAFHKEYSSPVFSPSQAQGIFFSYRLRYIPQPGETWRLRFLLSFDWNETEGNDPNLMKSAWLNFKLVDSTGRVLTYAPKSGPLTNIYAKEYIQQPSGPPIAPPVQTFLYPFEAVIQLPYDTTSNDALAWTDFTFVIEFGDTHALGIPTFPEWMRVNIAFAPSDNVSPQVKKLTPGVDYAYLNYIYNGSALGRPLTSKDTEASAKAKLDALLSGEDQAGIDVKNLESALAKLNLGQYTLNDVLATYSKPLSGVKALFNGLFQIQTIHDLLYFSVVLGGFTLFISGAGLAVKAGVRHSRNSKKSKSKD